MRTHTLRLWFVVALALTMLPAMVLAGRWQFGDNGYYTGDVACRDGVRLSWVPFDQSGTTLTTRVAVHHNTSGTPYDPNNILDAADYGPRLVAPSDVTAQSQATPLAADVNNSGGVEPTFELFTVYGSTTLRWATALPVGAEVVLAYRQSFETTERGIGAAVVADCRFAPPALTLPVTSTLLAPGPQRLTPAYQIYTVVQAPSPGGLRRGDVPLPAGSTFTHADLLAGRVSYGYESDPVSTSLRYRLGGLDRVSIAPGRSGSNSGGRDPSVSADGRYVAFSSGANNLVDGDTNGASDIFVRDMQTGQIARVSVATGGLQANGNSFQPAMTPDGRFIAFVSAASNLVPGDTNTCSAPFVTPNPVSYTNPGTCPDIFVHDRQTGATTRVSVSSAGAQSNGESFRPKITPDGRRVVFLSHGSTLVAGDTNLSTLCNAFTNLSNPAHSGSCPDVFVHDRQSGATVRVSLGDDEAQANRESSVAAIRADGQLVVFAAGATNLVPGDSNGVSDIFVRDIAAGTTLRLPAQGGAQPNGATYQPALTPDGRFVAFVSQAGNFVAGDNNSCLGSTPTCADIFVYDRQSGQITRVSLGPGNTEASNESFDPAISDNGRMVLFGSYAPNLASDDSNGRADVFAHDLVAGTTRLVSTSPVYGQSSEASGEDGLDLAGAGRYAVFGSAGASLVPGGAALDDVYIADLGLERTAQISTRARVYMPLIRR